MIKQFCDICKKELTRNVVEDRLIVERGDFKAEVLIAKGGTTNTGDLCYDCLIEMLTSKPRKPRSDKGITKKNKAVELAKIIPDGEGVLPDVNALNEVIKKAKGAK